MKRAYFVHLDAYAGGRQSDGVEFVYVEDWHDGKIHLFCDSYQMIWHTVDAVNSGAPGKGIELNRHRLAPVPLSALVESGLTEFVDGVVQYSPDGSVNRVYF